MTNRQKLYDLLADVFLLEPDEIGPDLQKADLETWDSLGTVALAVGVDETFGYHMTPEEATGLSSIAELIGLLETRGVRIDD